MTDGIQHSQSHGGHAFADFHGTVREGLTVVSRRNILKAGIAGMAGLSLPQLLQARSEAAEAGKAMKSRKSVILLWMAGGGFRHGQVIGSTEADGDHIKERPVTPGDLAATIYHHMDIPLDGTYPDPRGRPHYIVQENGQVIRELV